MKPYMTRIRERRGGMSKSFARIADFILDSYVDTAFLTASDLANILTLDPATVVRFAQHLGYRGYPDLLDEIRAQVKDDLCLEGTQTEASNTVPGAAVEALDEVRGAIDQLKVLLDRAALVELAEKIGRAERILVIAEGPARPSANNLVNSLEQGNFPVTLVSPGLAALARIIHNATSLDLWITIDFSGETPYLAPALREALARGVTTATIAGSPSLTTTYAADLVLAGRGYANQALQIIVIEGVIYTLVKTLLARYPERYQGAKEAIASLTSQLQ